MSIIAFVLRASDEHIWVSADVFIFYEGTENGDRTQISYKGASL